MRLLSTPDLSIRNALLGVLPLFALVAVFFLYVYAEKQIDQANDRRHVSFALTDELRDSSDALTRMVRSYVATGDPRFKRYFQDILDIRAGKITRPAGYEYIYWDFVLTGTQPPPQREAPGIPLLEMMRHAGFTEAEIAKLQQAQAYSDDLARIEMEAMRQAEAAGNAESELRQQAMDKLFGPEYAAAKAKIMQPINEIYIEMERRTEAEVGRWIHLALLLRFVFMGFALAVAYAIWRNYRSFIATLGGPPDLLHDKIVSIGQGDLATPISIAPGMENSVLAGLSSMRAKLQFSETERERVSIEMARNLELTRAILATAVDPIITIDVRGAIQSFNPAAEKLFGYSAEEAMGNNVNMLMPERYRTEHDAYLERYLREGKPSVIGKGREAAGRKQDGTLFPMHISVGEVMVGEDRLFVGIVQDMTLRKQAEEDLRVAATAFQTREAIMITDVQGNILRVNRSFELTTGYRADEVLGKNPRILNSGKHDQEFYAKMWEALLERGEWSGEIWDRHRDGHIYPKEITITAVKGPEGKTHQYVAIFSDITQRKLAETEIHSLAFYDPLTSLPNRRLLLERLASALTASARNQRQGALLFLDLDRFKTLNDTLGHNYGDMLLKEVASRIRFCVREVDTVSRLGGDEFVVLLENVGDSEEVATQLSAHIAEKIRVALAAPYLLDSYVHHTSPSIGAVLFCGNQLPVEEIIKRADTAMYQAKDDGRNRVKFFDPELQRLMETRAALETDLRRAIVDRQFELFFQIQVGDKRRPLGAEALIRWNNPQRGIVSPAQFIPVAEETNLIVDIGKWIMDAACRQLAQWSGEERTRDLVLAVNVSARQFRQPDFVDQVQLAIDNHRIDPSRLKLELTEGMALDDIDQVIGKMLDLRRRVGVSLALDDFGTGYSSLGYLKRLPLDQIKIDQSFVRDMTANAEDAVMVKTIIELAKNFGMDVIAEGVESNEHLTTLNLLGCRAFQGYLFSKPVPIDQFESLLERL